MSGPSETRESQADAAACQPQQGSRNLGAVQRWMQAVITHPGGVVAGIESAEARSEIDVDRQQLETVILPSRSCTSVERLHVYANAYYARLLECLKLEYPAFRYAVGDEAFDSFALGYLQDYPSTSYTLGKLGARFPQAIAKVAESFPVDDYHWPQLIREIAFVERTYDEVFDGPGEEQTGSLTATDLQAIPAQRIGDMKLLTSKSLRLLPLEFPVHEYISAVRQGEQPRPPAAADTWLVIYRRDFTVRRTSVSEAEFLVLESLQSGERFEDAIEYSLQESQEPMEDIAATLQSWFQKWTAAGFFRGCELSGH